MTDSVAVSDLLSRIEKWQDDYAYHPASYHDAGQLLDACRIVLGQQQARFGELLADLREIERMYATDRVAHVWAKEIEDLFDKWLHGPVVEGIGRAPQPAEEPK